MCASRHHNLQVKPGETLRWDCSHLVFGSYAADDTFLVWLPVYGRMWVLHGSRSMTSRVGLTVLLVVVRMFACCCNWLCLDSTDVDPSGRADRRHQSYTNSAFNSQPSPPPPEHTCKACGGSFDTPARKVTPPPSVSVWKLPNLMDSQFRSRSDEFRSRSDEFG